MLTKFVAEAAVRYSPVAWHGTAPTAA
jgi:hypothetical protein